jgi:large subunit ribosomal protein L30
MSAQIAIKLMKSISGRLPLHKRVAAALGLKRIRQVVIKPDTPVIRGMVRKIYYLVEVKTV